MRRPASRTGDLQVRVALVVAEQDVVARVQRLDQVVLEQQRFGFGAHHRRLHPRDRPTIWPMRVPRGSCGSSSRRASSGRVPCRRRAPRPARRSSGTRRAARAARPPRRAGAARAASASARRGGLGRIGRVVHRRRLSSPDNRPRCAGTCSAASSTTSAMSACAGGSPRTSARAASASACGRRSFGAGLDGAARRGRCRGARLAGSRHRICARRRRGRGLRLRPAGERGRRDAVYGRTRRSGSTSSTSAPKAYVERSHRLPSPRAGLDDQWFFYPGFTAGSGGLLREPDLMDARPASMQMHGAHREASRAAAGASGSSACSATTTRPCPRCSTRSPPSRRCWPSHPACRHARCRPCSATVSPVAALRAVLLPLPEPGRLRPPALVLRPEPRARRGFVGARPVGRLGRSSGRPIHSPTARTTPRSRPSSRASSPARRPRWPMRCGRRSTTGMAAPAPGPRPAPLPAWRQHCTNWRTGLLAQADLTSQLIGFVAEKR